MHRRTFIKGVLLSLPSLWIHPIAALAHGLIASKECIPAKGLTFFFLGEYGKKALEQFRRLERSEPILYPCQHVPSNSTVQLQLMEIGDDPDNVNRLISALFCDTAICVYDDCVPSDRGLAQVLCNLITKVGRAGLIMAMGPFKCIPVEDSGFDLTFQTWPNHADFMAQVLRTLYKTYVGCGRLGNCLCLKLNLQDILYEKCSHGILLYQDTVHHYKEINKVAFCRALIENSKLSELNKSIQLAWFIVEMHHREPQPYAAMDYIYDHNPFTDLDMYILPHASLLEQKVRVTLFGLY